MTSLVLCFCLFGAADPVAEVEGPESARVGDQMVFTTSQCQNAKNFKWLVEPKGTQGFTIVDGGKRLIFSAHDPGIYTIILGASNEEGIDLCTHTVVVGEHLINPTANQLMALMKSKQFLLAGDDEDKDEPQPEAEPVVVAKPQAMAEDTRTSSARWASRIQSPTRPRDAMILAGTLRQAANLVASGNIDSVKGLSEATSVLATKALGVATDSWRPWFEQLTQHLDGLAMAGKLATLDDYRAVWLQLADGLDAASR